MSEKEKSALAPRLRFPEFREATEWEEKALGEVISLEYGSSLSEEKRNGGTVPVVGSNGIVGYHDEHLVAGPAIVVGRKGSVGQVSWIDRDCYPIDTTYYVNNKNPQSCLLPFLSVLLERSNLPRLKDPSAVPGLNRDSVHSLISFFPKPPEQQKIADCLSSLDELITAETQKLDALKTHKKGLMQQLFPSEGETVPQLRFPEFLDAAEWEDRSLESVCNGVASGKDKNDPDGLYDLYGSTGIIGKTSTASYRGEFLLVARVGANAGLLTKSGGEFGATDNTLVVRLNDSVNLDFVFYYLDGLNLNKLVFGSGQPLITGGQLKVLSLYFPSETEQQKIADCLSSLDGLVSAQSQKIDALKTHKKGLMQQLFPVLDEVPA